MPAGGARDHMTERGADAAAEASYDALAAENARLRETVELLKTAQEMEREWFAREIREQGAISAVHEPGTAVSSAPAGTPRIRVLLAGDDRIERQGLLTMLQSAPVFAVVGEASNGAEAIQFADTLEPDVVLVDSRMPDMDGLETTLQIMRAHPAMAVIVLATEETEAHMVQALGVGAAGYLTKDCSREMLLNAVRSAARGTAVVQVSLLRRAVDALLRQAIPERAISATLAARLTVRELEVLGLLAQGHDYATIRQELYLAEVTVKKHVQSIVTKLGVADRTQAAILGVHLGLDRWRPELSAECSTDVRADDLDRPAPVEDRTDPSVQWATVQARTPRAHRSSSPSAAGRPRVRSARLSARLERTASAAAWDPSKLL